MVEPWLDRRLLLLRYFDGLLNVVNKNRAVSLFEMLPDPSAAAVPELFETT